MFRLGIPLFAVLATAAFFAEEAHAQTRPAYLDNPATVRIVGRPAAGERLPLLVVLPATGGSAASIYQTLAPSIPLRAYAVLLPDGAPSSSDYLPGFSSFLGWYDTRVMEDVRTALASHPIDPERVYLAGFSLGGDLGWALLTRHPDVFRGALVMGSRCSATLRSSATATLQQRGARVTFAIGTSDDASRVRGLTRAYDRIRGAHLETLLLRYEGGHQLAHDPSFYAQAFGHLFATAAPAAATAPASTTPTSTAPASNTR